jgi:hypothetical protein
MVDVSKALRATGFVFLTIQSGSSFLNCSSASCRICAAIMSFVSSMIAKFVSIQPPMVIDPRMLSAPGVKIGHEKPLLCAQQYVSTNL